MKNSIAKSVKKKKLTSGFTNGKYAPKKIPA
jgi:hypothetical protein